MQEEEVAEQICKTGPHASHQKLPKAKHRHPPIPPWTLSHQRPVPKTLRPQCATSTSDASTRIALMHINHPLLPQGQRSTCLTLVASPLPARIASVTASIPPLHLSQHIRPSKSVGLVQTATTQIVHSSTPQSPCVLSARLAQTKTANSHTYKPNANSTLARTQGVHINTSLVKTEICQRFPGRKIRPISQNSRMRRREIRAKVMLVTGGLSRKVKRSSSNQMRAKAAPDQLPNNNKRRFRLEKQNIEEMKEPVLVYLDWKLKAAWRVN